MVRELQERLDRNPPERLARDIENLRTHMDIRFLHTDALIQRVNNDISELGARVADVLDTHEKRLDEIVRVLNEHTRTLNEHTRILNALADHLLPDRKKPPQA
jgi:hypothetical protein